MKKADYKINCGDAEAMNLDNPRWVAARGRNPVFNSIYDVRLDPKEIVSLLDGVSDDDLKPIIQSIADLDSWDNLATCGADVGSFIGYVRRLLLHGRGVPYYIELKDVTAESYDHEVGWFGMNVTMPNVPEYKKGIRSPFQPYIPGRIVRVTYLHFEKGDFLDGYDLFAPLRIEVEEKFS